MNLIVSMTMTKVEERRAKSKELRTKKTAKCGFYGFQVAEVLLRGVGRAIRNYCGAIDKRRIRGCTTDDIHTRLTRHLSLIRFKSSIRNAFQTPLTHAESKILFTTLCRKHD